MMNKHVFYFCCLALPALWLTACEQGSDADRAHGELVPISVGDLWLEGELNTRAGGTPVTQDGSVLSLYLTNQGGYTPVYNKTYTCTSGEWTTADEPICVDKRVGQVVGVYDPNNVAGLSSSSTVTTGKLTAQAFDETKLWYLDRTHNSVSNTNAAVAFSMQCAYSRMVLQVERDASYLTDCKITEVTLLSGGVFYNDLPLDLVSGTLQGSGTTYNPVTTPLLKNDAGFVTISSGTKNIDLLLPPQTIQSTGLALSIKVDGQVRSVTIPYASLPKLASGTQYNVPLLILGPAKLIVNGAFTGQAWGTASDMETVTDTSGIS